MSLAKFDKFLKKNKVFTTSEALQCGLHSVELYSLRDQGKVKQISRGLYIDANIQVRNLDLILASKRYPRGVLCLISALNFHGLTTQIPRKVQLAYQHGWWEPSIDYPPIKIFRYSKLTYESGAEEQLIDGFRVKIYSAEKTIVDCFKFRNVVGLDIALEALKEHWASGKMNLEVLCKYATVSRVKNIMDPYLVSLVHD